MPLTVVAFLPSPLVTHRGQLLPGAGEVATVLGRDDSGGLIGVPAVVALGFALPLFGVPLLAFLAFDLLAGTVRGRRNRPDVPVSPAPTGS